MREIVSTISRKGQVTIPADVRRYLGVDLSDQIVFAITDHGTVELRPVRFTLDSVLGSLPGLPDETADLDREIEEATAEEANRVMRRGTCQ